MAELMLTILNQNIIKSKEFVFDANAMKRIYH